MYRFFSCTVKGVAVYKQVCSLRNKYNKTRERLPSILVGWSSSHGRKRGGLFLREEHVFVFLVPAGFVGGLAGLEVPPDEEGCEPQQQQENYAAPRHRCDSDSQDGSCIFVLEWWRIAKKH